MTQEQMNIIKGVGKVVNEIYRRDGCVTSDGLVSEASDPASPAHPGFEWDDAKAAQEHRLDQARKYLREITITIEDREEKLINVQVIHEKPKYMAISEVVVIPEYYDYARRTALSALCSAQNALKALEDAAKQKDKEQKKVVRARNHLSKAQHALG